MARHNKKGRTRFQDRFTNIPNYVLSSEAVRTLPAPAFKVMVYLTARCYGAKNNGKIVYGSRSGCLVFNLMEERWQEASIGLSSSTTALALLELQKRGLVVCTKASRFGQTRMTRTYRLTWVRSETEAATNEFFRFREIIPKTKPSPTSRTKVSAIVPPTEQPPRKFSQNQPGQSRQQDYRTAHSPTSGTLCNQGVCDSSSVASAAPVSEAVLRSPLSSAVRNSRGSKRIRAPAQIDFFSVLAAEVNRGDEGEAKHELTNDA